MAGLQEFLVKLMILSSLIVPTNAIFSSILCRIPFVQSLFLLCDDSNNSLLIDEPILVDFYRTFVETGDSGRKDYSIPKWRIPLQMSSLNDWFGGRVRFKLGDIYDYNNSIMHDIPAELDPCTLLAEFALSNDVHHLDRISVVVSKKFRSTLGACGVLDIPLGGSLITGMAPALIITMSNEANLPGANDPRLGIRTIFAGTMAHEIGHIMGFQHTGEHSFEGVMSYTKCGLNLRYPTFNFDDLQDDEVFDPIIQNSTTYYYSDWRGRSNIMAPFQRDTHIPDIFSIGLFVNNYEEIFEDIMLCWYQSRHSHSA